MSRLFVLAAALLLAGLPRAFAVAPKGDGRVHVAYWEKWVGFQAQAMQEVVDRFNRSQDRIFVEYFATSEVVRKTLVATAGGDPPDIAGLWTQNIAAYADAGALTPLDDFIRADGFTPEQWLERYYPAFARICTHAGKVYAGTSTPGVFAIHWNKTLFREAGLDPERPPRTLAELDEYQRKLTRRDPQTGEILQVGFLPEEPGWWTSIFYPWFGGSLFDGREITLGTDPRNLAAMKWVAKISQDIGIERLRRFKAGFGQQASSESAFFAGKVAIVIQGVYYNNYRRQYKPGMDLGIGPWPEIVPGIKDFAMVESDMLVIPRGAKHAKEAWEFIRYVNTSNPRAQRREELEGAELLCYLQEKNSPLRQWSPFFEQHHPHPYIAMFRELSSSPHAVSVPTMGMWQEYDRELVALFEKVRLLVATPEEAIDYAHRRMSGSWVRYRRSLERHGQMPATSATTPKPPAALSR
ncbi:MAG TPA: ABC transporter substrate-binding protein [Opitutaceae bacterium]|nr:ABC transporter substrate-binding protein [Opitutaceae bacterium]